MVSPPPVLTTVQSDTWIEATWDDFLTFADDLTLVSGRFYYDDGFMRIEMSPLGAAHGQDNSILSSIIVLYAALKSIPIKELTHTSFRKVSIRESQPDIAFYIGQDVQPLPQNNSPINFNEIDPPTLVIEVAASSLEDDTDRKQKLYQKLGVKEYWVFDVQKTRAIASALSPTSIKSIRVSNVLPGLDLALVEEALQRSQTEDDGAIIRWLISKFSQI
jgi:Uma2 family endonuclease